MGVSQLANEIVVLQQNANGDSISSTVIAYMWQGYMLHGDPIHLHGGVAQVMVAGSGPAEGIGHYLMLREGSAANFAAKISLYVEAGWKLYGSMVECNGEAYQAITYGKVLTTAPTGSGGSSAEDKFGWWNYSNTLPAQDIPALTWTTLMNNGEGPETDIRHRPEGTNTILDVASGKYILDDLKMGDELYVRHQINVIPGTSAFECSFGHRFGSGTAEVRVPTGQKMFLNGGAGVPTGFFLLDSHFYISDNEERLAGMYPQIYASNSAQIEYSSCYVSVIRR